MGYKHKITKDKITRKFMAKNELNSIIVKYYINQEINNKQKAYIFFKFLNKFHLNSSSARIVNRCILTGRASWVLRKFKISRISFKELADNARIMGIRRAT